TVLFMGQVMEP
nr:unnamed protein product [Homo sapiens]